MIRLTNPYDRKYFSAEIVIEEVEKDRMKPVRLPSAKYGPSISQSLTTRSRTASKINDSPDEEKDPLALSEKEGMKPVKKEATNYTAPLISQSLTTGSRTAFKIYNSPDALKANRAGGPGAQHPHCTGGGGPRCGSICNPSCSATLNHILTGVYGLVAAPSRPPSTGTS